MAITHFDTSTFGTARADLELALRTSRCVVRRMRPGRLTGEECQQLVEVMGQLERMMASGIALLAPRVLETGCYSKAGHASAPDWLAAVSGSSASVAKGRLAAAERAAALPALADALRQGKLSAPQLGLLASSATADPDAAESLLDMVAGEASHQELSAAAARMRACARSKETERARHERVHANRHFRWHQDPGGGIRGEFLCDEVDWARVAPTLEAATKARWKATGSEGGDAYEAHRLDAFIDLLAGGKGRARGGARGGARPQVLVLVDAEALRRGTTTTGEICEIEGIGPVPVEAAVELLGEGSLQFLVREGKDIRTVTKSTRDLAQKTAAALVARDRTCVVPGCGKRLGLQGDHCHVDFAADGPTELSNLALLCPSHHDMKTQGGWKIKGGPGNWRWIPPTHPPTADRIARTRRLAVARAKGRTQRSGPRQT